MALAKRIKAANCRKKRERCGRFGLSALLVGIVLLALGVGRVSVAWETRLHGVEYAAMERWNAVALDQAGDVVAAGVSRYRGGEYCTFLVTKFSRASGAVAWWQEFDDCAQDIWEEPGGEQVFIDPAGDVVVGRHDIGRRIFAVYKLSGTSGELLWHQTIGRFPKHGPFAHAITLDAAGNVIAGAGLVPVRSAPDDPFLYCHTDFVVTKLDATTGEELWRHSLRGTFLADSDCEDEAFNQAVAVAVDGAGDVIATGSLVNAKTKDPPSQWLLPLREGIILKLSGSDGAESWRRATDCGHYVGTSSFSFEWPVHSSVAVDGNGDVLNSGSAGVEKRSGGDGARIWHHALDQSEVGFYCMARMTVDPQGDVAVAALRHAAGEGTDIVLFKLAGTNGSEIWRQTIAGATLGEDDTWWRNGPKGIASDAAGNIVVAGTIENVESGFDFFVARVEGEGGRVLWRYELDGAAHGRDEARAVAVDAGAVAVAGSLEKHETWFRGEGPGPDAVTVLLDAAAGREMWRVTTVAESPGYDRALAVALDPAGDVFAAGFMQNQTGVRDFTVSKLSAATGGVIWSREVSCAPPGFSFGSAHTVCSDPHGDVIAAGDVSGRNLTVIKFDGASGLERWRYSHDDVTGTVAVDSRGDIVVSDWDGWESTLTKLSGSAGTELWRRTDYLDYFLHCRQRFTLDPADDVLLVSSQCVGDIQPSTVIKFDGTTGRELWRAAGPAYTAVPAVDGAGDVLLAGSDVPLRPGRGPAMVKLDGASGAELWRTVVAVEEGHYDTVAVEVDVSGNFLALRKVRIISPQSMLTKQTEVTKLAGVTGELLWNQVVQNGHGEYCPANDMVADAAGNVFVAGCDGRPFAAYKLAAADGTLLWYREIWSPVGTPWQGSEKSDGAAAIVVDAEGSVALGGVTATVRTGDDFTVVRWTACQAGNGMRCGGGSVPGCDGCSEECLIEEPSTTTTTTTTITMPTITTTTTTTAMPECGVNGDCDDGDACTIDECVIDAAGCVYRAVAFEDLRSSISQGLVTPDCDDSKSKVQRRIDRLLDQADQAVKRAKGSKPRKARQLLKKAERRLRKARKKAAKAAKKGKISEICEHTIADRCADGAAQAECMR